MSTLYDGYKIAVIIPTLDTYDLLPEVIHTIPSFVDRIIVVDDGSSAPNDLSILYPHVLVVRHPRNLGVGAAILTGYKVAKDMGCDVGLVMASDGQMDPMDAEALVSAVTSGRADYAKGDRLSHPDCQRVMPLERFIGNLCLTWLTRVITGIKVTDSQCGYTAFRLSCLDLLPLDWIYPRYGFPNDMLCAVSGARLKVAEVVVRPIYQHDRSRINILCAIFMYPFILMRGILVRVIARCKAIRSQK